MDRRVSVALPALNEAGGIGACIDALLGQRGARWRAGRFSIVVLANNCADGTAEIVRRRFRGHPAIDLREVTLLPRYAHAGWARRIAMAAAAETLTGGDDILLSTDADTVVAPHWLERTLPYFDRGYDAVAGRAVLRLSDMAGLGAPERDRLLAIGKYQALLCYLRRGNCDAHDPWPNHHYEGGASIAMTRAIYDRVGGCPPLPVGEDRALFDAVRSAGGKIRHAPEVKVYTSGRLSGRAAGGMADTIGRWCAQSGADDIHEIWPLNVELGQIPKSASRPLTFDRLPDEIELAKMLVRAQQSSNDLALTA
jgi:GT2 family glycosyltransferase